MRHFLRNTIGPFVLGTAVFVGGLLGENAQAAWHLAGWRQRAVVTVPSPQADAAVDTAAVKLLCQGHARPDGADFRVLDALGRPLPFQVMFYDAPRYALISFKAADAKQTYYIYFGNDQATRAAEEIVVDPRPGAGPPQANWLPRQGLVFATRRRPAGDNPKSVDELAAMLAASPAPDGARYQRGIADGFNPFGSSDDYLSIYRGWLLIPAAGRYRFCTASNEASFSFLDGRELVHWPGRHTADRGIHGEKNAARELTAGWHYIEYYHEEVALQQMAFLGWHPPDAPNEQFTGIAESVFPAPHEAVVASYETANGPTVRFEPTLVDTLWPSNRHEGQFTRVRLRVAGAAPVTPNAGYRWEFGDGQTATGAEVEHVYLALGNYQVKLFAQASGSEISAEWPLTIYEARHVTDLIREGHPPDYARLASTYDRAKLDALALKELAYLLADCDQPQAAIDVANEFVNRFADAQPEWSPGIRRLLAESALRLGRENTDEAVANYLASLTDHTPSAERFDVLARLIRLLGVERGEVTKADDIFARVEAAAAQTGLDAEARAAYRRAVIAAGDVRLWHARPDDARELYRKAEALAARPTAPQVRSAQIGAYPDLVRDFIESGDHEAALDVVDRWETNFPTEKLAGRTFFWRGKLAALRGQPEEAARLLARSIGLAGGAAFESEARWLLARALDRLGRSDDARRELAKLIASGFDDEFTARAKQTLAAKPSSSE
jgi:tetratricopeptide (TPR) repeat protein